MNQRDIYIADLNPIKGSEQAGQRPVVIVSGPTMNQNLGIVLACPFSTSMKNYETCVPVRPTKTNGLKRDSEVIPFQIRSISKTRLIKKLGKITPQELSQVFEGLSDVLKY